jgi:hypothetical protein
MYKKQLALENTVCTTQCDTDLRELTVILAVLNWKRMGTKALRWQKLAINNFCQETSYKFKIKQISV